MQVTDEIRLIDFKFWSGAKQRADMLTASQLDEIEDMLEDIYPEGIDATTLNDIFWFEDDFIAELLGFESWEQLEESME